MKTIIVLHGWQSSSEKWQNIKQGLEKQGLRVFVPDLPGFKPENQLLRPWRLDDYVNWLKAVYGGQSPVNWPVILLGHSFGGRVAIKFAAKYPELLSGLILVSAAGVSKNSFKKRVTAFCARLAKKTGARQCPLWLLCRKPFYRFVLRKTDWLKAENNPVLRETMRLALDEDLTPLLPQIEIPTLIIWGSKDKATLLQDGQLMHQKINGSRLEVLRGVGHTPHLECPELLVSKLVDFFQSF